MELLRVHRIADGAENAAELARAHITGPAFYVLRPDSHIGLAGTHLDESEITRYFVEHRLQISKAASASNVAMQCAA